MSNPEGLLGGGDRFKQQQQQAEQSEETDEEDEDELEEEDPEAPGPSGLQQDSQAMTNLLPPSFQVSLLNI